MDIDWSKAPEGATHYDVSESRISSFMKLEGGSWFFWPTAFFNSGWTFWRPDTVDVEAMIPRPAAETWNGEGLPPVGTVCEVLWNESRMEFLRTKVFGVNEHGQPIHRFDEGPKKYQYQADALITVLGNKVFRPIRTPEQIAAEKREAEILEIFHATGLRKRDGGREVAEAIYRAGYRKQVAP